MDSKPTKKLLKFLTKFSTVICHIAKFCQENYKLVICVAIAFTLCYIGLGEINNLMMYFGGGYEGMNGVIWVPELNMTALVAFEILWIMVALAPWVMLIGFGLWRREYLRKNSLQSYDKKG